MSNTIFNLDHKRHALLKKMAGLATMLPGAYNKVERKCGKPTCWCAEEKGGHPYSRITWTEDNYSRTKAIAQKDVAWTLRALANFQKYQRLLAMLVDMDQVILAEMKALQKQCVVRTRTEKGWTLLNDRPKARKKMQKHQRGKKYAPHNRLIYIRL